MAAARQSDELRPGKQRPAGALLEVCLSAWETLALAHEPSRA